MKLTKLKLENFRGYEKEITIAFNNLNVFVGENDVGKSTILEALDIFFNDGLGVIKNPDKEDINKSSCKDITTDITTDITISAYFENLPESIIIDTIPTNIKEEYLLNTHGELEIIKVFSASVKPPLLNTHGELEIIKRYSKGVKAKVYINANHPSNENCSELLIKKIEVLREILTKKKIECEDKTTCSTIRKSIWNHYKNDLQLQEQAIDVTKEDAKQIWEKLKNQMPLYTLFQSDRSNNDGDSEVQDPMKIAVKQILKNTELANKLNEVSKEVKKSLEDVSDKTLDKLKEMNSKIAASLTPVIPADDSLKWADVFKSVSISDDEGIPLNKRGSGVKRLILLNFFRAEADRKKKEKETPSIIYAIEEPETSQHPDHQNKLIEAFKEMSRGDNNTQIIMTTHSPAIVKLLDFEDLQLIKDNKGVREVTNVEESKLDYPSLNEVNYLAFGETTEEYHNELYGFLQNKEDCKGVKDFDNKFFCEKKNEKKNKPWIGRDNEVSIHTWIRNNIHHPPKEKEKKHTSEELKSSVEFMRSCITK